MFSELKLRTLINAHRFVRALLFTGLLLAPLSAPLAQEVVRTAAVVNEEEITVTDLIGRTDLVIFSSGLPNTQDIRERTMRQVLQILIDESLQNQEAKAMGIDVKESEIQKQIGKIARDNKLQTSELAGFLAQRGIAIELLISQIKAAIAWGKVVRQRLQSQVEIGDEEVDEAMQLIESNRNRPRQLVSEIFLAVDDPAKEDQVRQSADRIVQQIRNGSNFGALARAFSQSSTAAVGGDLGWLVQGQLDEAVERTLAAMPPGTLADPIRAASGYHIIMLRDRRQPGGGQPDQVTVELKQILLPMSAEAKEEEMRAVMAAAQAIRESISSCGQLGNIDSMAGAPVVSDLGTIKVSDLAAQLRPVVMALEPGRISTPMRGKTSIAMFIVCDRTAAKEELPDREQVRERLILGKLDLLARRYIRDLRRAAFIDIRAWSASQ